MAKRKKSEKTVEEIAPKPAHKMPVLTKTAYQITFWVIVVGLFAQIILGIVAYPRLPNQISTAFAGSAAPYHTMSKSVVLFLFPAAEIVVLILALYAPRNEEGKRVMESGTAWSLILLTALFTALQASSFHIPYIGI